MGICTVGGVYVAVVRVIIAAPDKLVAKATLRNANIPNSRLVSF